jgi:hypothetical protein
VIGQGDRGQSCAVGGIGHRGGHSLAVRGRGVRMEVHVPGRLGSDGQRRYSVSAAVHEGCDWANSSRSWSSGISARALSTLLRVPTGE